MTFDMTSQFFLNVDRGIASIQVSNAVTFCNKYKISGHILQKPDEVNIILGAFGNTISDRNNFFYSRK